jgi:hypothetical protein
LEVPVGAVAVAVFTPVDPGRVDSMRIVPWVKPALTTDVQLRLVNDEEEMLLHENPRQISPALVTEPLVTDIAVVVELAFPVTSTAWPAKGDVTSATSQAPVEPVLNVQVKAVWPPTVFVSTKQSP